MAEEQSSMNTELRSAESSNVSQSLLPQGENQEGRNINQMEPTSEESSYEISGFSNIVPSGADYSSEVADPFNNIFYRVIPSETSTHIHFYAKPLFQNIISVLEKEFRTPGEDVSKFLLKTHVDSKRCHIHVDRSDLTIIATGPGHVFWKENNFRKMTLNMYKIFVDQTNTLTDLTSIFDNSRKSDTTKSSFQADTSHDQQMPGTLEPTLASDSTVLRNISSLMDMIHALQGQVTKLTAEVNKLVLQASVSFYKTVSETHISQNEETPVFENSRNQTAEEDKNVHHEPVSVEDSISRSDRNFTNHDSFTRVEIRSTSTPRPKPRKQSSKIDSSASVPSRKDQTAMKSRPVPKPRNSIQAQKSSKKILLIGDSIISWINPSGLKEKVYKHGISGATIDMLLMEIAVYDLQQFSHVIIYIGGNNASNKTDTEYFEEKYDQLLAHIKRNSQCRILLVNSCPRGDADITEVNETIRGLSEHYGADLVDVHGTFFNRRGELIKRYYLWDHIHLSDSGVKRLLGAINHEIEIVEDFTYCIFSSNKQQRSQRFIRSSAGLTRTTWSPRLVENKKLSCDKCGETNHNTRNCKHADQLKCHHCGYYGHKSKKCGNQ